MNTVIHRALNFDHSRISGILAARDGISRGIITLPALNSANRFRKLGRTFSLFSFNYIYAIFNIYTIYIGQGRIY